MKKYIIEAGYQFVTKNDLTNKQFTLTSVSFDNGETSTLSNWKLDRTEVYSMFLNDLDTTDFKQKFEGIIHNALEDLVSVVNSKIDVEKVENGYNLTLVFDIRG